MAKTRTDPAMAYDQTREDLLDQLAWALADAYDWSAGWTRDFYAAAFDQPNHPTVIRALRLIADGHPHPTVVEEAIAAAIAAHA